ncbi:TadE family type IV pilus minor pilin [Umezawaea sp. Da 62-37]|uniref:TadE family type IV pilus minor pilin n=1 Tax=Umezawaea sp. Da 62-37 TaxID=3075927 RepID=UPI0028F710D0|nr:TadE family type IV pilus minor pilin [Umezawaea sp. Da 62-37]WNV91723.1 TadE family type IV pilus minor pilin [Umezawaea sp. Da 62-37]
MTPADDRGAATVEAAIAIFSLALVLTLGSAAVVAVADQLRCTDAAREAARLVARGEPERAESVVTAIAPAGARLEVSTDDDAVRVVVVATPANGLLPGVHLEATAYAVLEPTTDN